MPISPVLLGLALSFLPFFTSAQPAPELQERISQSLDSLGGFWQNGMKLSSNLDEVPRLPDENEWKILVAETMRELIGVKVDEG